MLPLVAIVGPHDGPGLTPLHGSLEGGQIELIESPVAHLHIDRIAVILLVVQGKVLYTGGHPVGLYPFDIRHYHFSGQVGVLAHIFKITPVQRCAVDIHPGAQQHILVSVASLLAYRAAVQESHLGVPRSGQTGQSREGHARVVGPTGLLPLVPSHLGPYAVRPVGHPVLGQAQSGNPRRTEFRLCVTQGHLLFKGHSRQGIFDALLDSFRIVQVNRSLSHGHTCDPQERSSQ